MIDQIYNKIVLERYNDPIGYGTIEDYHKKIEARNRLCGDSFDIYLKLEGNKISEAKFDGDGCALSIASTSLLVEHILGLTIDEANELARNFLRGFDGESVSLPEKLSVFASVNHFRARRKCITLPWEAFLDTQ